MKAIVKVYIDNKTQDAINTLLLLTICKSRFIPITFKNILKKRVWSIMPLNNPSVREQPASTTFSFNTWALKSLQLTPVASIIPYCFSFIILNEKCVYGMKNTAKMKTMPVGARMFEEIIESTYLSEVNCSLKHIPEKK